MDSITSVLSALSNPDPAVRVPAEQSIQAAKESDLSGFILAVLNELRDDTKPDFTRYMAGTLLKNAIAPSYREVAARRALEAKWKSLSAEVRKRVRDEVLTTLGNPTREVRSVAANIIGSLSRIELPQGEWPELMSILVEAARSGSLQHQEAALTALGYIGEEGHNHEDVDKALQPSATEMLGAIVHCMSSESDEVKFAATNALCNAMEYVQHNMQNITQRDVLIDALCSTVQQGRTIRIRERAMEALVKVAEMYYSTLPAYITRLHSITSHAIFKEEETVGLQAAQFWISICEVERDMKERGEGESCLDYAGQGLQFLVSTCLHLLQQQQEDQTEDDWNLSIAGGKLLQCVSETVGLPVQAPVMRFVFEKVNSTEWREREAAVMAFGCLLGNCESDFTSAMEDTVAQATPGLLKYLHDSNEMVADTSAWVLAVVCEHYVDVFLRDSARMQQLMNAVGPMIGGGDCHMGKRACAIVHNLALAFEEDDEDGDGESGTASNHNSNGVSSDGMPPASNELSPFYGDLVSVLLHAIDHDTGMELKSTAQETLNTLIDAAAKDSMTAYLANLAPELLKRMAYQLDIAAQRGALTEEMETMLGLLCGAISALSRKLKSQYLSFLDPSMQLLLRLFESYADMVHCEALIAIGSIAYAVKAHMKPYMDRVVAYILRCLGAVDEPESVYDVVSTLGDLCLTCQSMLLPYAPDIMNKLYEQLVNVEVDRDLKGSFVRCFGDVILNVLQGEMCVPYLPTLMPLVDRIFQASTLIDIRGDPDGEEYVMTMWEGISVMYSNTMQSFRGTDVDALSPYLTSILTFAMHAIDHATEYSETRMAAVTVIGDMAAVLRRASAQLRQQAKEALCTPTLQSLIERANELCDSDNDRKTVNWTRNQLSKLSQS